MLTARLAKSFFPGENKTSPSSPNITPGSYLSSGGNTAGKYSLCSVENDTYSLNDTIPRHSPSNASSTNASLCRFVVQDTININYWACMRYISPPYDSANRLEAYYMISFDAPFNLTSIVTEVTQYIDTTITRQLTNVTSTFVPTATPHAHEESYPVGPPNEAPGPLRAVTELKKDADLTSWGSTFSSPGTFYVYPTVKIITVPAITQKDGQLACTTAITRQYFYNDEDLEAGRNPCGIRVFTGMNSNAQQYFDSSKFYPSGGDSFGPAIDLPTHELNKISKSEVATTTTTTRIIEKLVFATPFAYKPDWGLTNRDDYGGYNLTTVQKPCPAVFDHGMADYGYVPQALIDQIATPGESLLPGGPSILDGIALRLVAPAIATPAEDLTVSTAFTVTSKGCFNPEGCLINDAPDPVTITSPTPQSQVQRLTSKGRLPPPASKTNFPASLDNTHRVTSALKPSAAASTVSAVSSAEMAHLVGESPITAKVSASLSQSPSSITEFQFESQTLAPGGVPTIFSSKTYSLAPSATAHFVNDAASALISMTSQGSKPTISGGSDGLFDDGSIFQAADKSSPYIVGGSKVMPGSAPVVVSGITYSLDSSAATIIVNDVVSPLPKFEEQYAQIAPILSIGSQLFTANAASEYLVGGRTVSPTGNAIVVSGSTYSLVAPASEVVLDGVTSILPGFQRVTPTSRPILSVGSSRLTADAAPEYILDDQTRSPGGSSTVISGSTYTLSSKVSALAINGITSKLSQKNEVEVTSGLSVKIGSQYLTADSALKYIMGSETLVAGSTPIIVSGTTYSLAAQASALVANGVTSPLPTDSESIPLTKIRIGSQYLTLGPTLGYDLGGKTLIPGANPIIFSGSTYSLAPQVTALVIVNGVTSSLQSLQTNLPQSSPASGRLQYILGGQTLSPGVPAITISGVAVSLAPSGNTIVINGTSYPFQPGTAPSLSIGSQLLVATPASRPVPNDQTSKIGAAASTTSNGNTSITPSATNVVTGSTNSSHSTTPSINGDENPSSVFTDGVSQGEIGWTQRLMVLLVVLGLTVL
ncbi:hypothetical protein MMC29_004213 [Sticta canariensis]|nr:hypothetical protein [Sticta canariensis]